MECELDRPEYSQSNNVFLFITFFQCDVTSALERAVEESEKSVQQSFEKSMLALSRSVAVNRM